MAGSSPAMTQLIDAERYWMPRARGAGPSALNRRLLRLHLLHLLPVQRDEIDRGEQQRREAAVAHGGRNDLAREREQQARALDQHDRVQALLRHVLNAEDAGE